MKPVLRRLLPTANTTIFCQSSNSTETSSLNICLEMNNPNGIIKLVHSTKLIAIMSSLAAYYDPMLKAIPVEGLRRKMTGCVHTLKGAYLKKSASLFIKTLKDTL